MCPGYFATPDGIIYTTKRSFVNKNRNLTELKRHNVRGYLRVNMRVDGKRKYCGVHRLVLETFRGPGGDLYCNHINGNKSDNRIENLEWVTPKQNSEHAQKMGRYFKGEERPHHKLKESDIPKIIAARNSGRTYASIGKEFGISYVVALKIYKGEKWAHVPREIKCS